MADQERRPKLKFGRPPQLYRRQGKPAQTHAPTQHCQERGSHAECRNRAAPDRMPLDRLITLASSSLCGSLFTKQSPDCTWLPPWRVPTGRKSASQRVPVALSAFPTVNHQIGISLLSPQKPNCTCPWEVALLELTVFLLSLFSPAESCWDAGLFLAMPWVSPPLHPYIFSRKTRTSLPHISVSI